jgi:5-methylthioadenosine/S-adenosylhomocysteine deaminase
MDTAAKLSKVFSKDPVGLEAKTALKMATNSGAVILDIDKQIGTIEIGKRADLIVVDLSSPHLCPIYEPHSALVYSANGSDVKDVIVNGRVLMKDRTFMTLDPEEIMSKMRDISRRIQA